MTSAGTFSIKDFSKTFSNYLVYVSASNGLMTQEFTSYLLDITITEGVSVLVFKPQFFSEPLPVEVNLKSEEKTFSYELPLIFDANSRDTHEITIQNAREFGYV